ncbi:MAG: rhomboid family intramembrane serine protease [Oligoflexales bacterium]
MRKIVELSDFEQAKIFRNYLNSQGITVHQPDDEDGVIWVLSDDQIHAARLELQRYEKNPQDEKYTNVKPTLEAAEVRRRYREVDVRTRRYQDSQAMTTPLVTLSCLLLSVGVYFLPRGHGLLNSFRISLYSMSLGFSEHFLMEVMQGQIWRLVTPIFLHSGFLHLLMNMLWLWQLGGPLEQKEGSRWTGFLILLIAIPSNVAFYVVSGPWFGGMSGVIYGLLGYMAGRDYLEQEDRYGVDQGTVTFLGVWYVVCITGLVGAVANTVHGVGALMGLIAAAVRADDKKWLILRRNHKVGQKALIGLALLGAAVLSDRYVAVKQNHRATESYELKVREFLRDRAVQEEK